MLETFPLLEHITTMDLPDCEIDLGELSTRLSECGYRKSSSIEQEGTWTRRGDIIDIYPVSSELPIRLELFGDQLDKIKELNNDETVSGILVQLPLPKHINKQKIIEAIHPSKGPGTKLIDIYDPEIMAVRSSLHQVRSRGKRTKQARAAAPPVGALSDACPLGLQAA